MMGNCKSITFYYCLLELYHGLIHLMLSQKRLNLEKVKGGHLFLLSYIILVLFMQLTMTYLLNHYQ